MQAVVRRGGNASGTGGTGRRGAVDADAEACDCSDGVTVCDADFVRMVDAFLETQKKVRRAPVCAPCLRTRGSQRALQAIKSLMTQVDSTMREVQLMRDHLWSTAPY